MIKEGGAVARSWTKVCGREVPHSWTKVFNFVVLGATQLF